MRETNLDHFNEERRKGTKEEKEKAKRNPYPVEEGRETTPEPIPDTGHYLDRVGGRGEMATGEETEKERGNPAQRQHQEEEQELQHQQQKEERKQTRLRQATLNWPARGVGKKDISMNEETRVEKKQEVEESTWMMG